MNAIIYTFDNNITPETINYIELLKLKLLKKGISKFNINIHPLYNDIIHRSKILKEIGKEENTSPVVYIDGEHVVDIDFWSDNEINDNYLVDSITDSFTEDDISYDTVNSRCSKEWDFDPFLSSSLGNTNHFDLDNDVEEENNINIPNSKTKKSSDTQPINIDSDINIGIIGQTLEGVERSVVNLSWGVQSAMNFVGLSPTDKDSSSFLDSPTSPNRHLIAEYTVVQTNWYYRQQKRTLRFFETYYTRIHPITKKVRVCHSYSEILKVTCFPNDIFTIDFKDESKQEYYQSNHMKNIVELLRDKNKEIIIAN